jgi:biofilm PGA synthesis N-glycosyltransferase PgaC
MSTLEILFWSCLILVLYTYAGYPLLLSIFAKMKKPQSVGFENDDELPKVSLIIACYNEASILREKVSNTLALDYPKDKLEILFITDGSNDGSEFLLKEIEGIKVLHQPERRGKTAAMNRAVEQSNGEILVFTDANTFLPSQALRKLIAPFADARTGCVAGEKRVRKDNQGESVGSGEGLYWKYESFLKKMDARLCSATGAAGELFAIRGSLWEAIDSKIILDDFYASLRVVEKGYRIAYTPDAYAEEYASVDMKDEWKRKIRIASGGFQSMFLLGGLFSFKRFVFTWQYVSHRLLRWTITPLAMLVIIPLNALLLGEHWIYDVLLYAQIGFYLLAFGGYFAEKMQRRVKAFFLPYYFTFMHAAALIGGVRYFTGKQSSIWEKAKRA